MASIAVDTGLTGQSFLYLLPPTRHDTSLFRLRPVCTGGHARLCPPGFRLREDYGRRPGGFHREGEL